MFWLNHGTALHYAGDLKASSSAFFKAEEAMQDLFTKSISEDIGRFVATETVQTYAGEDYERILTYLYTAINAAGLGKLSDALVEVRRADAFLQKMRVEYEREGGLGTLYTQDAFVLWLIGLFLEMEGTHADAHIAYVDAYKAYESLYASTFGTSVPPYLGEDLVRSARLAGLTEKAEMWRGRLRASGQTFERWRDGDAEIILVHGNGESPFKKEVTFNGILPDGFVVRVAVPELVARTRRVAGSVLVVGGAEARSVVAEPVERIALRNFEKRVGEIRARAVARAAIKYAATKATSEAIRGDRRDQGRNIAGLVTNILGGIVSAASEGADLRSWTLLPAEFRVARIWVPAGTHPIRVELVDRAGNTIGRALSRTVKVRAGERRFLSVRSVM